MRHKSWNLKQQLLQEDQKKLLETYLFWKGKFFIKNHYFFCLYQQNKSSESKVKFRQAINSYKRAFEAAKLSYANSTKESILFQKLGSRGFRPMATKVLNKGKSLYLLYPAAQRCCLVHQNCLLKTFLRTLSLTTQVSLPDFSSRTNLKLHNITVSHKMVKKVIMNLDFSNASGPDCIPVVWVWTWTFVHTSWTLQEVSEGVLFSRLLKGFIGSPCI